MIAAAAAVHVGRAIVGRTIVGRAILGRAIVGRAIEVPRVSRRSAAGINV